MNGSGPAEGVGRPLFEAFEPRLLLSAGVEGSVWYDVNGDGVWDPDERPLEGWTVYVDSDDDGAMLEEISDIASEDVPKPPAYDTVRSELVVDGMPGYVVDVNVTITTSEGSSIEGVDAYLISPAGTRVELFTELGEYIWSDSVELGGVTFDDEAPASIRVARPDIIVGIVGSYRPEGLLSVVDGEDPNGIWALEISLFPFDGSLENWSITLTTGEKRAVTDFEGNYALTGLTPGEHVIRDVLPSNWTPTEPAAGTHSIDLADGQVLGGVSFGNDAVRSEIRGQIFDDLNANGTRDSGEAGLDGRTVELLDAATRQVVATQITTSIDLDGSGVIDPETEAGLYVFTDVLAGIYEVREAPAEGWEVTFPAERLFILPARGINPKIQEVDPVTGEVLNEFYTPIDSYRPRGYEPHREGIAYGPGRLFYLDHYYREYGMPGDAYAILWELDPDTGDVIDSDVVDTYGYYSGPGDYKLAYLDGLVYMTHLADSWGEIAAWNPDTDQIAHTIPDRARGYSLTGAADRGVLYSTGGFLSPGEVVAIDPYTGEMLESLSVSAALFGPGASLQGMSIGYWRGEVLFGMRNWRNLFPYVIHIDPDLRTTVGISDLDPLVYGLASDGVGGVHRVVVGAGETLTGIDFGEFRPGEIRGQTFVDLNADGARDAGEFGFNGWWVEVVDPGTGEVLGTAISHNEDLDGDGSIDPETEVGIYSLRHLPLGDYLIRQIAQDGWTQTLPAAGAPYDVTLGAGETIGGRDFGNTSSVHSFSPLLVDLLEISDTGVDSSDDLTNLDNGAPDRALQFEVTGTVPGATVTLYHWTTSGTMPIGSALAAGTSTVVVTDGVTNLSGWRSITARQTEAGKGESAASPTLMVRIDTTAPTVIWYSAAQHAYGVGEALLEIPDDASFSEPRSSGIQTLILSFSEPIDPTALLLPGSVQMAGLDAAGAPVDLSGVTVTTSTRDNDATVVISFGEALDDHAKYAVRVGRVWDPAGNELIGSNERILTALVGDVSGDLRVNATDLSRVRSARARLIDPRNPDQVRADVTTDGRVNATDLSRVRARRPNDAAGIPDPVISSPTPPPMLVRGVFEGSIPAAVRLIVAGDSAQDGEPVDALGDAPIPPARKMLAPVESRPASPARAAANEATAFDSASLIRARISRLSRGRADHDGLFDELVDVLGSISL